MAETSRPRKRRLVRLACNRCRHLKAAVSDFRPFPMLHSRSLINRSPGQCDAAKPACGRCTRRGVACVYVQELGEGESRFSAQKREANASRTRLAELEQALQFLRTLPEHEAARRMKHVLQSDGSPVDALASLADASARSILPPIGNSSSPVAVCTTSSLSFELTSTHPNSYPGLITVERWQAQPETYTGPRMVESS